MYYDGPTARYEAVEAPQCEECGYCARSYGEKVVFERQCKVKIVTVQARAQDGAEALVIAAADHHGQMRFQAAVVRRSVRRRAAERIRSRPFGRSYTKGGPVGREAGIRNI